MAVIINDFEIIVQRPPAAGPQAQLPPPAPAPVRPLEIVDVLRRHAERTARLTAY